MKAQPENETASGTAPKEQNCADARNTTHKTPIVNNETGRASIFTQEQENDLRRLKAILPYRIVWGAVKAETGEFITGADYDRRKLMRYLRKGWLVASIQ